MKIRMKQLTVKSVLICILITTLVTHAQLVRSQETSRVHRVENDGQLSKAIPYAERFQFQKFQEGTVYLWGGRQSVASMNYSYLFNEIQFLNERKDTLSIAEKDKIRFISLAGHVYLHDKFHGFAEMMADTGGVKLGMKKGMALLSGDKYLGYGQYTGSGAVGVMKSYINRDGKLTKLDAKTNLVLTGRISYFLIDKNNKFYPASEAACRKLFSRSIPNLKAYLKSRNVDFQSEDDLRQLLIAAAGW